MTQEYFDCLYTDIKNRVERKAKQWRMGLWSMKSYTTWEWEDLAQEMWLEIWTMPEGLVGGMYIDIAFDRARVKANPERMWHQGQRGKYVLFVSLDEMNPEDPRLAYEPILTLLDRISMDMSLEALLDEIDYKLWNKYLRYQRCLKRCERSWKKYHFKHYLGWTQKELAKIFGVDQSTISRRTEHIENTMREILQDDYGIEIEQQRF